MNEFGIRLSLLYEITTKKKNLLDLILNITFNQNCIAMCELDKENRNLFMEIAKEKQKLIDEVYSLDIVFQRTYDQIKHLFNSKLTEENKQKLIMLQNTIDEIILLDKNICEIEANNSSLLETKKLDVQKINIPKSNKNKVIEQYNKQNSNFNKHKFFN